MKELVLTLKEKDPLGWFPKQVGFTEFKNGDTLIADTQPEKDFSNNLGEAEWGFYFMVASEILSHKKPLAANKLKDTKRAKELEKKLFEVAKKGPKFDGEKGEEKLNWYEKIFGESPKNKYVYTKSGRVGFSEKWGRDNSVLLKICPHRSGEEVSLDDLELYCKSLLGNIPDRESSFFDVTVRIHITRTNGRTGVFSNKSEEAFDGYIRKNDVFYVEVKTNYKTSILIVWIDAMGGVFELFPEYSKILGEGYEPGYEYNANTGKTWACFPYKDSLTIDTKIGVENCLVFTKSEKFSRDDIREMKLRIRTLLQDNRYCISSNQYDFCEMYLGETPNIRREFKTQMDLEGTPKANEWRSDIVEQMSGFAKSVQFLQLSHTRPGSC